MSIQIRINEFDHIELDNRGDIWEFSTDNAVRLADDIKTIVRTLRAERRLQQLLEEWSLQRNDNI